MLPKNEVTEINIDDKKIDSENRKERVTVYNTRKESNKEIIKDITEQRDIHELIDDNANPIKESTVRFRTIRNSKK